MPDELLVDQRWPENDALVKVSDYDVRIAPVSSVISEAILWAITPEVAAEVESHARSIHGSEDR